MSIAAAVRPLEKTILIAIILLMGVILSFPFSRVAAATPVSVWWPTNGARVSGVQPVKALLDGQDVNSYKMYWSVDGGGRTEMPTNYTDWPHKENQIDYTNWNWKGEGPYTLAFTATDYSGNVLGETKVNIYVAQPVAPAPAPAPTPAPSPAPIPTEPVIPAPAPTLPSTTTPVTPVAPVVSASGLYVDPYSPAFAQAVSWKDSRPQDAAIMQKMGNQSSGIWLGGWNVDVAADVSKVMKEAAAQNTVPTFVVYNIPLRDCGSYSAGGLASKRAYVEWVRKISGALGSGKAIIILEPDALAGFDCLSSDQKTDRYSMLSVAIDVFKSNTGAKVYLDAGHANWVNAKDMAYRLNKAGIARAAGFSLNVSNFVGTTENTTYGQTLSKLLGDKHFVIDTSRNGVGSNGEWCNPSGRALGKTPTLSTGDSLIDAYLWIKRPGESDGNCNGGPNAGVWWPEYALDVAKRAGY